MPNKVKVEHSQSKSAWNIVGQILPDKYKIARFPYFVCQDEAINTRNRLEALEHANICAKALNSNVNPAGFAEWVAENHYKLENIRAGVREWRHSDGNLKTTAELLKDYEHVPK